MKRLKACDLFQKSRPQGLVTLSTGALVPTSLKVSFNPQRPWASPFKAFPYVDRMTAFPSSLRSCASDLHVSIKTRRSSDFLPTYSSSSLTRLFISQRNRSALLGFPPLRSSQIPTNRKASPFPALPLALIPYKPFSL